MCVCVLLVLKQRLTVLASVEPEDPLVAVPGHRAVRGRVPHRRRQGGCSPETSWVQGWLILGHVVSTSLCSAGGLFRGPRAWTT